MCCCYFPDSFNSKTENIFLFNSRNSRNSFNFQFSIMNISSVILIIVAMYVAYTHGWTSEHDQFKEPVENLLRDTIRIFSNKDITQKDINRTISFAEDMYSRLETREMLLGYANIKIAKESPSYNLFLESYPEPESLKTMQDSLIALSTSSQIVYEYCNTKSYDRHQCRILLKYFKLWDTQLGKACQKLNRRCTKEEIYSKYRSIDGTCNNVNQPEKGQSFTVYGRLLYPNYMDGIKEPRRSITKDVMVSPTTITSNLYLERTQEKKRTLAILYWGQFIEHDLTHSAMSKMLHTGETIECCSPDGKTNSPRYVHPFCFPIKVYSRDEYYSKKDISCLSYVRSIPGLGPDCSLGPMQQVNQATHFLDASQIYGTTRENSKKRRSLIKGQLKMLDYSNSECEYESGCYDKRVHINSYINALYTLWLREHNRIAKLLAEINREWDDETIFNETRRVVIAEIQHITYNEWIPSILGDLIQDNYDTVHNEDPSVSNVFSTAAIRALRSIIPGKRSLINAPYENELLTKSRENLENLFGKMLSSNFNGKSLGYSGKMNNKTYGYDVLGVDIQRGRDHGLPTYNAFRKFCGLKKLKSFEDLEGIMGVKTVESLKKSYKDVEDIDVIVGGLSEKPSNDEKIFGPTFSCIFLDQFRRTKMSDRYFYTNGNQPMPFSESQLDELKKVTLARIICDNMNISKIQTDAFELSSNLNSNGIPCDSDAIPRLNMELWNMKRYSYS